MSVLVLPAAFDPADGLEEAAGEAAPLLLAWGEGEPELVEAGDAVATEAPPQALRMTKPPPAAAKIPNS
ncbi:MAG: hypothetical protein ACYDAG_04725 [Chloroflexota bacterium]